MSYEVTRLCSSENALVVEDRSWVFCLKQDTEPVCMLPCTVCWYRHRWKDLLPPRPKRAPKLPRAISGSSFSHRSRSPASAAWNTSGSREIWWAWVWSPWNLLFVEIHHLVYQCVFLLRVPRDSSDCFERANICKGTKHWSLRMEQRNLERTETSSDWNRFSSIWYTRRWLNPILESPRFPIRVATTSRNWESIWLLTSTLYHDSYITGCRCPIVKSVHI